MATFATNARKNEHFRPQRRSAKNAEASRDERDGRINRATGESETDESKNTRVREGEGGFVLQSAVGVRCDRTRCRFYVQISYTRALRSQTITIWIFTGNIRVQRLYSNIKTVFVCDFIYAYKKKR